MKLEWGETTVALVVERLYALGEGAPPKHPRNGICYEIGRMFSPWGYQMAYVGLGECFLALGLDETNPLGPLGREPWEGEEGRQRRALCLRLADFIAQNPNVFLNIVDGGWL